MNMDKLESTVAYLKALAHPTRIQIIKTLADGCKCVSEVEEMLRIKQANASQHLNILKNAGIVVCRTNGNQRCYSLANPDIITRIIESAEQETRA